MNERLGVAVRLEAMPSRDQVTSQFLIAVDFAVENDPDGAVFVRDWLMTGIEVDDAEPPHAEAAWPVDMEALVIRPAMANPVAHRADLCRVRTGPQPQLSRDAAHTRFP